MASEHFIGEEIYQILPHRYPIMVLDELHLEEGKGAEGIIRLREDEWFFSCHFPGRPMMPGFLLLEAMGQVLLATFIRQAGLHDRQVPMIMRVEDVSMRGTAFPGEVIVLRAVLDRFKYGIAKGSVRAFKGDRKDENVISSVRLGFAAPDTLSKQ